MRRTRTCAAAVLAAALTIAGCGGSATHSASTTSVPPPATGSSSAPAATAEVNIANYAYAPVAVTVRVGTKVTFVNHDTTAHTATAGATPGFDTGSIKPNGRATVTLAKAGTYSYICQFHPFMKATISVG